MSIFHLRVRRSQWDQDAWAKMSEKLEKTFGGQLTNKLRFFLCEMFRDSKNWKYHVWQIPWEILYINCFFAMKFGTLMTTSLDGQRMVPATAAVAKDSKHHHLEVR